MSSSESGGGGGGLSAAAVVEIVVSVVRAMVPDVVLNLGQEGRKLLSNPYAYIVGTVLAFFTDSVLTPLFAAVATIGRGLIRGILVVFLGRDQTLSATGSLGLADIPLWAASRLIFGGAAVGAPVLRFLVDVNQAIISVTQQAGPAAPIVAVGLYGALALGVGYAGWWLIQIIDIPLINLGDAVRVLTAPFRWVLEVTR